jgi:hypothetical protein
MEGSNMVHGLLLIAHMLPWLLFGAGGGRVDLTLLSASLMAAANGPSDSVIQPQTAPSASEIIVVGGLVRTLEVTPGAVAEVQILVRNPGTEPQVVRAYLRDYGPPGGEPYGFPEPGTIPRSNAAWLTLLPEQWILQPGETAPVTVQIRVPDDVRDEGSFWSVVMVERVPPAFMEPPNPEQVQIRFREVFRTAVRVVTEVEVPGVAPAPASLRFAERGLRMGESGPELDLAILNDGARVLRFDLWAELFDASGTSWGRHEARRLSLLPGELGHRQIALDGLPPGTWEVLIVADDGAEAVFGVRDRLVLPEEAQDERP